MLCQNGESRNISDQEIQRKLLNSRAVALDKKHNHVSVGEMVNVVEGTHAGHSGTVKHIYRTFLFLHANRMMTNAGIFVARARQTVLSGSKARSDMIQNSTITGADGRPSRAGMPPRGGARNESEMVGKTVKVKKGQWKGYIGIVVEESEQKVKVEIHCKAKVVEVDRLHVTLAGNRQGMIEENKSRYSSTPMNGQTPMPSQTPLHGGMTPMATPMHRGFGTPSSRGEAWNVANDDALLETQMNQEKDITHATTFGAPLEPVGSSDPMSSSGGRSYGISSSLAPRSPPMRHEPITPAPLPTTPSLHSSSSGLHPRTPAYMNSHSVSTPGLNPTTPGMNPSTPHITASTPGMHHGHGMEPMTPGFNPTTPGLSAMTPGMNPVTPGMTNTPGFHNPMTPGFGVGTPGLGRMHSAATPVATPGMMMAPGGGIPMTPAFHHDADEYNSSSMGGDITWKTKGVEVEVVSGPHRGRIGVITNVSGNMCTLDCDGHIFTLSCDEVQPTIPEKQDTVLILSGDEAGKTGSLIGVDGPDGIVKVDGGSDIKLYAMATFVKFTH